MNVRTLCRGLALNVILGIYLCAPGTAQVFDESPTASKGEVGVDTGQALYGTFGRNAKVNPNQSYSLYRKLFAPTNPEIHTFTPVPGNNSAAKWEGVDHGGPGSGYHDPGMYIGNVRSISSYSDQLIYFSENRNGLDEIGGNNLPNGTTEGDSNSRVNWEVSVGFLEDAELFVDGRSPNSEAWDLWDRGWSTDGVQMRLFFTATNSSEIGNAVWFSFNETAGGEGPGARPQSGDPNTAISGEQARDVYLTTRRRAGSKTIIPEGEGDFLAGGGDGQAVHVGVGYNDEMELSWKMELNDPNNADPVRKREVRFTTKTGNLLYESVFDPGAPGSPVVPNPTGDPGVNWKGDYFDWQKASPIFYLGLDNGTDYGENGASGIMGIFEPGDFNADGKVDSSDLGILNANIGKTDTSYSRGDIDQDGDTDANDLASWQSLVDPAAAIDAINNYPARVIYVHNVVKTWIGDSNLDGVFSSTDFVAVFQAGLYETGGAAGWRTGDWNGDGVFSSSDFVVAFQDGGYEVGPRPAVSAVPEPTSGILFLSALLVSVVRRRRIR